MSQPLSAGAVIVSLFLSLVSAGCTSVGATSCKKSEAELTTAQTAAAQQSAGPFRMYVGTYTGKSGSKGIYQFDLDLATGAIKEVGVAAEVTSPSFLALSPDQKYLYAVGEMEEFKGKKAGAVSAFSVDAKTGGLTLLNQQPSGGAGPCHVSVDGTGKVVLVANYGAGSVASFPVGDGGTLGEAASVIQHEGSGPDQARQKGPHAHGIWPSPDNRFVLACDLGTDKVMVYKLDAATVKLTPNDPPAGDVPPGAGARHIAFGHDDTRVYCINEMGNTLTTFSWDAPTGTLKPVQTVSTLPKGFDGTSHTAEVVVHPGGKFVYGSNRGHDSIAVFTVRPTGGELDLVETTPIGGKWPRHFNVDPTGQWLIAAGEHSNTLTVFKIDQATGKLTQTGDPVPCPQPACVIFAPAGK